MPFRKWQDGIGDHGGESKGRCGLVALAIQNLTFKKFRKILPELIPVEMVLQNNRKYPKNGHKIYT
jgi:hypothetical protein